MVVFNTFTVPVEGIVQQESNTRAYLNEQDIGSGTLYITESVVSWCDDSKHLGFSLQYPDISLHAVRRDPFPALYLMVDRHITLPEGFSEGGGVGESCQDSTVRQQGERQDDDEEDQDEAAEDEEGHALTELMFSPRDDQVLERLFLAMNQCQQLHPDPNDDAASDIYEDASDIMDDDNFVPVEPMDQAEENMQGLHIGVNNGMSGDSIQDNNGAEYDAEDFPDDDWCDPSAQ